MRKAYKLILAGTAAVVAAVPAAFVVQNRLEEAERKSLRGRC
ncbi:hypothetical protein QWM81_04635 [Streptomyces ficellus]|uniref:Uncharacterized protein n=1 Tax=Streptomyces ficellus TaxID=1977088 RepID=A0ABT7Z1I2_9ACTN|nr:hypothetical protein [Streptomyces ficellus]MDN3293346.1 hypothetical protein [Streptomyces ficellus]